MKFPLSASFALCLIARAAPSRHPQVPIMGWSGWNHFRVLEYMGPAWRQRDIEMPAARRTTA